MTDRLDALEQRQDSLEAQFHALKNQLGVVHATLIVHNEEYAKMRTTFEELIKSNTEMVSWFKRMHKLQQLLELTCRPASVG